jgi:hypothetical protein
MNDDSAQEALAVSLLRMGEQLVQATDPSEEPFFIGEPRTGGTA